MPGPEFFDLTTDVVAAVNDPYSTTVLEGEITLQVDTQSSTGSLDINLHLSRICCQDLCIHY